MQGRSFRCVMLGGAFAHLFVTGCVVHEAVQELPKTPGTSSETSASESSSSEPSSSEQGEESSDTKNPLPKKPDCSELVKVKFDNDQGLVRPGMRVEDLLAAVTKPIPFRFEAQTSNQFSLTPELDGAQGTLHLEPNQFSIKYEYWKQPNSTHKLADTSGLDADCEDTLSMSASMKLRTEEGVFDESIRVYLNIRFKAGGPIDLSTLAIETMIEAPEFARFFDKFEVGEPKLAPGDVVGQDFYELTTDFVGGVPKGWFGAFQEVIVEGSDAKGPKIPVVSAIYRIKPVE